MVGVAGAWSRVSFNLRRLQVSGCDSMVGLWEGKVVVANDCCEDGFCKDGGPSRDRELASMIEVAPAFVAGERSWRWHWTVEDRFVMVKRGLWAGGLARDGTRATRWFRRVRGCSSGASMMDCCCRGRRLVSFMSSWELWWIRCWWLWWSVMMLGGWRCRKLVVVKHKCGFGLVLEVGWRSSGPGWWLGVIQLAWSYWVP